MRAIGLLCFICLLAGQASAGDDYITEQKAAQLVAIQKLIFNDRFELADSAIVTYVGNFPGSPEGHLFRAGMLLGQMTDAEEAFFSKEFDAALDTAATLAKANLVSASPRTRAWMYLVLGHCEAYRSVYASHFSIFTSAINHGYAAKAWYDKGKASDSTLYDLYLGIGSFHYWKSAKAGLLRWLRLFKNEKAKGVAELQLAADSSIISREAARHSLIWVYLDAKRYDEAAGLAEIALKEYPDGKSFLWPLAQAQFERKDYAAALATYGELRRRLLRRPGNYYNLVECDYYLTRCYDEQDEHATARLSAAHLEDYYRDLSEQVLKRQRGNLSYLKKVAARDEG